MILKLKLQLDNQLVTLEKNSLLVHGAMLREPFEWQISKFHGKIYLTFETIVVLVFQLPSILFCWGDPNVIPVY